MQILSDAATAASSESALMPILITVVTTLSGAVSLLWRVGQARAEKTEKRSEQVEERLIGKLDACEENHAIANSQLLSISTRVGKLEGKLAGYEDAREDFSALANLSADVLKAVHEEFCTDDKSKG